MTEFLISIPSKVKEEERIDIQGALNIALEPFRTKNKVWIEAKDETYNGWTNYETWCINLWLFNDRQVCDRAQEIAKGEYVFESDREKELKDYVYDLMHSEDGSPVYITDDISTFRVNWREVMESLKEE